MNVLGKTLMMKRKSIITSILLMLFLPTVLMLGCQTEQEVSSPQHTFNNTYYLTTEERSITVSGSSDGMPGEQSEYILKINNGAERWQDEYYVLLIDNKSVIREISHGRFDIPSGSGTQEPITATFPRDFKGALGLCVIIPQRASMITTLSIGVENANVTGWPDVSSYPVHQTQASVGPISEEVPKVGIHGEYLDVILQVESNLPCTLVLSTPHKTGVDNYLYPNMRATLTIPNSDKAVVFHERIPWETVPGSYILKVIQMRYDGDKEGGEIFSQYFQVE